MVNIEFLKKHIQKMDVKSNEFWELYCTMCDKYFNFPDPDDFERAVMGIYA